MPGKPLLPCVLPPRSAAGAQTRPPEQPRCRPARRLLSSPAGSGGWRGNFARMRLRASGRVATRDRWRRAEQRRASHSPRGFPELWRAIRAHAAGPGLCRGRSSLGCAIPVASIPAPRVARLAPGIRHRHLADPSTSAWGWGCTRLPEREPLCPWRHARRVGGDALEAAQPCPTCPRTRGSAPPSRTWITREKVILMMMKCAGGRGVSEGSPPTCLALRCVDLRPGVLG